MASQIYSHSAPLVYCKLAANARASPRVSGALCCSMPKRSSRPSSPEDMNETAFRVLREATGEKNPAAVELGRLGGKKGGPARAAKLSPKKRQQIARKAAMR